MLIPRSRGAVSGVLLIILGAFGALISLIGPYFDFTVGATDAWSFSDGHVWLSVVPGVAVLAGGLLLTLSANRAAAGFGAWLALAGGIWMVIGGQISRLWNDGESIAGAAAGGNGQRVAEQLVFYEGLGVLITALAAFALGRLAVRSVRDAELEAEAAAAREDDDVLVAPAPEATTPADEEPAVRERPRFDREPEREPVAVGTGAPPTAATASGDTPATAPTTTTGDTPTETLTAADRVRQVADDDTPSTTTPRTTTVRRRSGGLIGRWRR
jgi:hypothetical protein